MRTLGNAAARALARRARQANVKTPVAAGIIVSVLGLVIVKAAVLKVQKHSTLPAPAPELVRMSAYLMLLKLAPDAVNTSPTVEYVSFICLVEAPTVHCIVAGRRFLPFAA
jgi:hypothetical protein